MKNKNLPIEFYQVIAKEAMMGILIFDEQHKCVFSNTLIQHLLDIPEDIPTLEISAEKFVPEGESSDRTSNFNLETLTTEGQNTDVILAKWNGEKIICNLGVKQLGFDRQVYSLLLIQDVTLQKKLQREVAQKQIAIKEAYEDLLKQNEQLKALDVAKNRFIAITTHELRTPLAAMVGFADLLKNKLYDTQEELEEFIETIHSQGQHMTELVNDILDFAKIQANKMDYYVESHDLDKLAKDVVSALTNMAHEANVELSYSLESIEKVCYFDKLRLNQVVTNLVNNAIKYNRKNGKVEISVRDSESHLEVHIEDTGVGIGPEDLDNVFNEFETLGKTSNHSKGTGLGLPISRRMMRAMGGDIELESEPGKGSHFWIKIPKDKVLEESVYRSRPDESGDLVA